MLMHDGTKNYKVTFLDLKLKVRKVLLRDQLVAKHEASFARKEIAAFPFKSIKMSTFTIGEGVSNINFPNLCQGVLPSQVLVGFIEDKSYNGNAKTNPFIFRNLEISNICFRINGKYLEAP